MCTVREEERKKRHEQKSGGEEQEGLALSIYCVPKGLRGQGSHLYVRTKSLHFECQANGLFSRRWESTEVFRRTVVSRSRLYLRELTETQ